MDVCPPWGHNFVLCFEYQYVLMVYSSDSQSLVTSELSCAALKNTDPCAHPVSMEPETPGVGYRYVYLKNILMLLLISGNHCSRNSH